MRRQMNDMMLLVPLSNLSLYTSIPLIVTFMTSNEGFNSKDAQHNVDQLTPGSCAWQSEAMSSHARCVVDMARIGMGASPLQHAPSEGPHHQVSNTMPSRICWPFPVQKTWWQPNVWQSQVHFRNGQGVLGGVTWDAVGRSEDRH